MESQKCAEVVSYAWDRPGTGRGVGGGGVQNTGPDPGEKSG